MNLLLTAQTERYNIHLTNKDSSDIECSNCNIKEKIILTPSKNIDEVNKNINHDLVNNKTRNNQYVFLFNRMNYMDYFIITLSQPLDEECKEKYLNSSYYYKNVVNFLMPGDPYPEAKISTSNVFGLCYMPQMYEIKDTNGLTAFDRTTYSSQVWTGFGILKIHINNWMYLGLFFIGIIVALISFSLQILNFKNSTLINCVWVMSFPFYFLYSMGVDHSVMCLIVILVRWTTFFILMFIIEKIQLSRKYVNV